MASAFLPPSFGGHQKSHRYGRAKANRWYGWPVFNLVVIALTGVVMFHLSATGASATQGGDGSTPCSGATPSFDGYLTQNLNSFVMVDSAFPSQNFAGAETALVGNRDTVGFLDNENEQRILVGPVTGSATNLLRVALNFAVRLAPNSSVDSSAQVTLSLQKLTASYNSSNVTWANQPTVWTTVKTVTVPAFQLSTNWNLPATFDITDDFLSGALLGETLYGYRLAAIAVLASGQATSVTLAINSNPASSHALITYYSQPDPNPSPNPTPSATPFTPPTPN